jgi:Zn2+/Cd2+-exporting ATPase
MREAENIKPAVTRLLECYAGGYMALVLLLTTSLWFLTGSSYAAPAIMANAGRLLKFQDNVFSVPA